MSRIFFNYPNARVTGSTLLGRQSSKSLHNHLSRSVSALRFSESEKIDCLILKSILPYLTNLACCCNADYYRIIAPKALQEIDQYWEDSYSLFCEIQQPVPLRRQVEVFLARFDGDQVSSDYEISQGQETCRLLCELTEDINALLSFHHAKENSSNSNYHGEVIQAQADAAKESKNTSAKLRLLNQLAYVFLPLQLTASIMGMNLRNFGTGNIELWTFLLILVAVATISFIPLVLQPLTAGIPRIREIMEIMEYSPRVGYLFGWFCLFHHKSINDKIWYSGICSDIRFFKTQSTRQIRADKHIITIREGISTTLRGRHVRIFARYWQGVLDELFEIIDRPQWGRKDMSNHIA